MAFCLYLTVEIDRKRGEREAYHVQQSGRGRCSYVVYRREGILRIAYKVMLFYLFFYYECDAFVCVAVLTCI